MVHNYYAILEVDKDATIQEIADAYDRAAARYHPDKNPENKHAARFFELLTEARDILCTPEDRDTYDDDLALYELEEAAKRAAAEKEFWKRAFETRTRRDENARREATLKENFRRRIAEREAAEKAAAERAAAGLPDEKEKDGAGSSKKPEPTKRPRYYWEV